MTRDEFGAELLVLLAKRLGCEVGELGTEWVEFAERTADVVYSPYKARFDPQAIGNLVCAVVDLP